MIMIMIMIMINIIIILQLSCPNMGLSGIMKRMIYMEHNMVKNANWYWGEPVGYFTGVAENLNSGQLRTNPGSSQSRTSTRGLRNTSSSL